MSWGFQKSASGNSRLLHMAKCGKTSKQNATTSKNFWGKLTAASTVVLAVCVGALGDAAAGNDIPSATSADVVIVGEVHDNPHHHDYQARLISQLDPTAVVFEMLTKKQAASANSTKARGPDLAAAIRWEDSGWPDWDVYQSVFEAVGQRPIVGMALNADTVRNAVTQGAASMFPGEAARFGLDRQLPKPEQIAREALQAAAHCDALPEEMLPGMVEAQRLRDAHFADVTLQAFQEFGGPIVVITGTGHARRDWGIPAAMTRAAPDVTVVAIGQFEQDPDDFSMFDHINVTPPAERPDPCAVFQKSGTPDG
ncbi:MAG: ChaN family lipoprotein [Pseudomonadota bacterium]